MKKLGLVLTMLLSMGLAVYVEYDGILDPQTPTNSTILSANSVVVPANSSRKYLRLTNEGTGTMYLALGKTALVNKGIRLASLGTIEFYGATNYKGAINAINVSPSAVITILESN